MGARRFARDARDKLLFWGAVVGAAPPLLIMWWFGARAREPPIWLYVIVPAAVIAAAVLTAYAVRRSRLGVLLAPLAVLATCTAGTAISGDVGCRKVLASCEEILRARESAGAGGAPGLDATAAAPRPHCRILDQTWGTWEMGVFSGDREIGRLSLTPDGDRFVASNFFASDRRSRD